MALYNLYEGIAVLSMLSKPTDLRFTLLGQSRAEAAANLAAVVDPDGSINQVRFDAKYQTPVTAYFTNAGFPDGAYTNFRIMLQEMLKAHETMFQYLEMLTRIDEDYSGTGQHPGIASQIVFLQAARVLDAAAIAAFDQP